MDLLKDKPEILFHRLLLPSIGGILVYSIYSFIDMVAIGHGVGANGSAANAVLLPLFQIPSFTSIIAGLGGSVLMSTSKGQGKEKEANQWFTVSLVTVMILILLTWSLTWFFKVPVLKFFGADSTILPYALDYGKMIIAGFPFFTLAGFWPFILRNDNNPDLPLFASLTGGVINAIGDFIFVFPLRMGMFGAGLATLIGSFIQNIILLSHFIGKKRTVKLEKPEKIFQKIKTILPYGFGSAFMEISMVVTTIITNRQIMKYGTNSELAVFGFMLTVVALIQYMLLGIGQAAQPVISTNFGAKLYDRVKRTQKLNTVVSLSFAVICTALCVLFPQTITRIFVKDTPGVMNISNRIIRIYVLLLPFMGINTASILNLQSVGKDKKANTITLLRGFVVCSILLFVLPLFMGLNGIWWATSISEAMVCIYSVLSK